MEVQVLRYYKYVPAFQMEVFSFWIHTCVSLHKTSVIIWSMYCLYLLLTIFIIIIVTPFSQLALITYCYYYYYYYVFLLSQFVLSRAPTSAQSPWEQLRGVFI